MSYGFMETYGFLRAAPEKCRCKKEGRGLPFSLVIKGFGAAGI
jgi:hypothetical protein